MRREEIDAIKRRWEAATDGWYLEKIRPKDQSLIRIYDRTHRGVCKSTAPFGSEVEKQRAEANIKFIAHAREDVPRLVAEVERLRELIGWMYFNCEVRPHSTKNLPRQLAEIRNVLEK
jgi:hypothetical protein